MFYFENDDCIQHDLDHSPGHDCGDLSPNPDRDRIRSDSVSSAASFASAGRPLNTAVRTNKAGVPLYTPPHMRQHVSPNYEVGSCPLPTGVKRHLATAPVEAGAGRRSPRKPMPPPHGSKRRSLRTNSITAATFAGRGLEFASSLECNSKLAFPALV